MAFSGGEIDLVAGKAKKWRFTVYDAVSNTVQDISMYTAFKWMAKNNLTDLDNAAVITKTLGAGITMVDGPHGILEVLVPASDTTSLTDVHAACFAELQGVDFSGQIWTLWQGSLIINPHVIISGS